jgi:phosphoribosylformimino-5-aminoimidazole carboxamide ribonucleotide (ProFAR) isomerase
MFKRIVESVQCVSVFGSLVVSSIQLTIGIHENIVTYALLTMSAVVSGTILYNHQASSLQSMEFGLNTFESELKSMTDQNVTLSVTVDAYRSMFDILQNTNKSLNEIEIELRSTVSKYKTENKRQEINNLISTFLTSDINRDGILEGSELIQFNELLKTMHRRHTTPVENKLSLLNFTRHLNNDR